MYLTKKIHNFCFLLYLFIVFCLIVLSNGFGHDNDHSLRILLFAESFPSFTSGITRRFKEIIRRLAKKRHRIHVITGCKVCRESSIDCRFFCIIKRFFLFI